jgi:phage shock protein PspC (stress-responsive transcriptional regulator)
MGDIPPELQPDSPEDYERRKRRMWLGIGIPGVIGAGLALALGIPWWIVAIFVVLLASGVFLNT